MTSFEQLAEFNGDFVKLCSKYKNLPSDFETLKQALIASVPRLDQLPGVVRLSGLGAALQSIPVYKTKKFRSRDFPGKGNRSGFRFIFAFVPSRGCIVFLEGYHKNQQENEDRARILRAVRALLSSA